MSDSAPVRSRAGLYALLAAALVATALAVWFPRWWEMHLYRQTEALTGVGAPIRAGRLTDARKKIDPNHTDKQVLAALGPPSMQTNIDGTSSRGIWTYYYADGTMVVNFTDGIVVRIDVSYGPPPIPTSRRP
ncbi:MAG TPA: hypothetical protein VIA45_12840 [Thermoanaerobaculia bacterium]